MMDEYIRKQDALDAFRLSEKTRKYGGDHSGYDTRMLYEIQDTIESIEPAADVVPVVHGKWIPHSEKSREYIGTVLVHVMYDYWLCDTCGYRVENGQPMYNFCPNCGAKMDGGDEHE